MRKNFLFNLTFHIVVYIQILFYYCVFPILFLTRVKVICFSRFARNEYNLKSKATIGVEFAARNIEPERRNNLIHVTKDNII